MVCSLETAAGALTLTLILTVAGWWLKPQTEAGWQEKAIRGGLARAEATRLT